MMATTALEKIPLLSTKYRCWSKPIERNFKFRWTIENFSWCGLNGAKEINSHHFPTERFLWSVEIALNTKQYVSAYIKRCDYEKKKIYSQYSVSFVDSNGIEVEKRTSSKHLFCKETPSWGWPEFIEREKLLEELKDDILVIEVELTYTRGIETISDSIAVSKTDSLALLSTDFTALYENSKHCDVTIRGRGTEIKAHSQVLTARSPVFAAMFEHDTVEKETKRIDIPDIDIETLRALIHYMYSGKTPEMDEELAKALLEASDKYAVESLKDISSDYLASNLSTLNVVDIMIFADLYSASDLRSKALKFICDRKISFDFVKHGELLEKNGAIALQILKEIAPVSQKNW